MKLSGNFIISLLILLINILFQNVHSQDISLVFTSSYNDQYLESDSVVIENITQNCDTTLHFPDTVLYLDFTTAVSEHSAKDEIFTLSQNYPNPVSDRCRIELKVFREDIIEISLVNSLGQVLYNTNRKYDMGNIILVYPRVMRDFISSQQKINKKHLLLRFLRNQMGIAFFILNTQKLFLIIIKFKFLRIKAILFLHLETS